MDIKPVVTIALISLLGAMSPGPDFAIVTKNCLTGSLRSGLLTALGVACALLVHVTYCILGIAIVIQESPLIFHILKYLGSAYLFYLGLLLLKEKTSPEGSIDKRTKSKKHHPFLAGFLCNLLNPKATLFVLSLFTQFIDPNMDLLMKALLGSTVAFVAMCWFGFLSYLITHRLLHKHFARFQWAITKIMGVFLCGVAIYMVFIA